MSETLDPNVGLDQPETPDVTEGRRKIVEAAKVAKSDDPMIAALLREREGYVQKGQKDRVKAVDDDLKRRGHVDKSEPKDREAPKKSTATSKPKREG